MSDSPYGSDNFIQPEKILEAYEEVSIVKKFMNKTTLKDFDIKEKLGEGSYSTVYKVIRKSD